MRILYSTVKYIYSKQTDRQTKGGGDRCRGGRGVVTAPVASERYISPHADLELH